MKIRHFYINYIYINIRRIQYFDERIRIPPTKQKPIRENTFGMNYLIKKNGQLCFIFAFFPDEYCEHVSLFKRTACF